MNYGTEKKNELWDGKNECTIRREKRKKKEGKTIYQSHYLITGT